MPNIRLSSLPDQPIIDKNFSILRQFLNGGVALDNLNGKVITGVSSGTANTQKVFPHGLAATPNALFVILGNVYIFDKDPKFIDIRSTQTSVKFQVLCLL